MRRLPYFLILKKFSKLSVVKIFFLVSFSMVTHGWTFETSEHTNAASIMAFADNLSHHGYHYRAVMEYERLIYFYPKHPDIPKTRFKIACSMKSSANYTPALQLFSSLAKEYEGISPGIEASFQKAEIFYLTHDYQSALKQYEKFISLYPKHQLAEEARNIIIEIEKRSPQRSQRTQR
jgi:tetratricopeptide (TPR) repeat protein